MPRKITNSVKKAGADSQSPVKDMQLTFNVIQFAIGVFGGRFQRIWLVLRIHALLDTLGS